MTFVIIRAGRNFSRSRNACSGSTPQAMAHSVSSVMSTRRMLTSDLKTHAWLFYNFSPNSRCESPASSRARRRSAGSFL